MRLRLKHTVWTVLLPLLFLSYSLPVFVQVLVTTESVIDEEFHLRQGLHFCNNRFDMWDEKITTFPGLYLMSVVLQPLDMCSVLGLRMLSLLSAAINVVLLFKIRIRVLGTNLNGLAAMDAITIAALPPLYFFNHLYYTDTMSLTSVLFFYYYWMTDSHLQASVFAAGGVLMRQTNIVWVGMCCGITALDVLVKSYAASKKMRTCDVKLCDLRIWHDLLTTRNMLLRNIWQILCKCCFYLIIILPFVAFVCVNGSIVVGDKSAHTATLHLPQLFYFSLFSLFFGISNVLEQLRNVVRLMRREKLVTVFLIGVFILIAKWNTLVHPYLLSDNRHYIFYVWNRFYGKYEWFKYAMTPVYLFSLALMFYGINHMRSSFKIMYWLAVLMVLCFQGLLEIRYFLVPFIIFRLNTRPTIRSRFPQCVELGSYIAINVLAFYVFFTKEINWVNFREPQRIIW